MFPGREKTMAAIKASGPAVYRLTLVAVIFFIVEISSPMKPSWLLRISLTFLQLIHNRRQVGQKAKPLASLLFPRISALQLTPFSGVIRCRKLWFFYCSLVVNGLISSSGETPSRPNYSGEINFARKNFSFWTLF